MKKWLSAILMVLLLVQAMPLGAFAAAGHVLTDEELAAAYALTGFGDSSVQSNATYHKGMKPNVTWNAMQVSEWLDEQLKTYVFSVEDILTRASIKLAKLQESDPEGYSRFSDDSSEYTGVATYISGCDHRGIDHAVVDEAEKRLKYRSAIGNARVTEIREVFGYED